LRLQRTVVACGIEVRGRVTKDDEHCKAVAAKTCADDGYPLDIL